MPNKKILTKNHVKKNTLEFSISFDSYYETICNFKAILSLFKPIYRLPNNYFFNCQKEKSLSKLLKSYNK